MATIANENMTSNVNDELRALQFNVWLDATKVKDGLELTASVILESGADVVSLCEVKNLRGNFVERLKKKLQEMGGGATYHGQFAGNPLKFGLDADTAILSRYPVMEEKVVFRTSENCVVRSIIDLGDRGKVAVYSVHLEYRHYSCYLPRGYSSHSNHFPGWGRIRPSVGEPWFRGWFPFRTICAPQPVTDPELIRRDNLASNRREAIMRLIQDARLLEDESIPIIVMGDFNEPSTLDWTEATGAMADHNGLVYKWDTTECLRQHGYADSYRVIYPNPATHPGFTWPAAARGEGEECKRTDWIKGSDERDRIDYIFCKGDTIHPTDSWLVGTPLISVKGEIVDESQVFMDRHHYGITRPWPSDHRAVMTNFILGHRLKN